MKLQYDTLVCKLQPALGDIRLQPAETFSCAPCALPLNADHRRLPHHDLEDR